MVAYTGVVDFHLVDLGVMVALVSTDTHVLHVIVGHPVLEGKQTVIQQDLKVVLVHPNSGI